MNHSQALCSKTRSTVSDWYIIEKLKGTVTARLLEGKPLFQRYDVCTSTWWLMRVKHPKSLQTGCAEQTIGLRCCFRWYPLLQFIIPLFRYFNTLGQNVQRFYTRTRQKYGLKAEQPKLWLCVCVFFFSGSTFWARTFKRIIFFLLCVVLSFAYALCDQFDDMIMPCDTFRKLFAKI